MRLDQLFPIPVTAWVLLAILPAASVAQTAPAQWMAASEDKAIQIVIAAARSDQPAMRANAMEAIQWRPERALPLLQMGFEDPNPAVRFVALVTAGQIRTPVARHAAEKLLNDRDDSVKAAAMFALHRIKAPVDLSPMAKLMGKPDPTVRGNVAMLLGRMGDPSAIDMMTELSALPMPRASTVRQAIVRLQVAEAVVNLGQDKSLDVLRAAVYSEFDEVRILAVMMLGRQKDRMMVPALEQLLSALPFELALASAGSLAQMGQYRGLPVALNGASSVVPTQRAQAAFVLRHFSDSQAAAALVKLLDDPDPAVRLSAAAAVLMPPDAPGN